MGPFLQSPVVGNFSGSASIRLRYPIGHKTPAHEHQLALTSVAIQSDDGPKCLWRNVPTRAKVGKGWAINLEVIGNALLVCVVHIARTWPEGSRYSVRFQCN